MFRMKPIADAERAALYFGKTDGGYYVKADDLRREWGGLGADKLDLTGTPTFEQFHRLIHGLDPHTGKQLTALLVTDRIPAWDFTCSIPKGVTTALEGGDSRIREALWEAGRETMADLEQYITTRVRKGGKDDDRVTGNMVWFGVEHPETRPTEADGMPDWDRHLHFVGFNVTRDDDEGQWKAIKMRPVFDMKKYFDRRFDLRMSSKLAALGYEIKSELRPDSQGGMRHYSWDIKPAAGHEQAWNSVNVKNSRRSKEVEDAEKEAVAAIKEKERLAGNPDWASLPDTLSKVARDKLGASSRKAKRDDMTLDDFRAYWNGRITPDERRAIDETVRRAIAGENPKAVSKTTEAMAYAIAHHFERSSVVDFNDLAITAMERSMGGALPEDFEAEAKRQGVLFQGRDVSTQAVWDQERRIIDFARSGKGTCRPLAAEMHDDLGRLSDEQKAAVRHVWHSTDRLLLIRGGAGTGKTTMMTPALAHLGVPAVLLAPSSEASRGELRRAGFADANTVAAFLGQRDMQEQARGGIIWVDEAGLLPINDLDGLCTLAKSLDARIVLQGDPKQHRSVQRHGNMLTVLEDYAGLPVAKLTTIQRQKGDYAKAVGAIRDGDVAAGDAVLRNLGWVVEGKGHEALVAEYTRAIEERKPTGALKSVLVIDPTHRDGDLLSDKLRAVRKAKGLIKEDETTFPQLKALGWTEPQRADAHQYGGDEVIQFFRNSGTFKAGDRVAASALLPQLAKVNPKFFAVYRAGEVKFAEGDDIRITTNGRDITGKHRLDNGRIDRIRGFTPGGDLVLSNGWVVGKDFAHMTHGLVRTSMGTQSNTEDVILAAMNKASLGAMGAEQGYVTVSRGRERGMIFTDLSREELLRAVARSDNRKSATELFRPKPKAAPAAKQPEKTRTFMEKVRTVYRQLQRKAAAMVREPLRHRELDYAR